MASLALDSLQRLVTPELLAGASLALGESEDALARGFRPAFAALLAPLADHGGDTRTMQRLTSLVNDPALASNLLTNPSRVLDALPGSASRTGSAELAAALLVLALGDRTPAAASAIARHAGLTGPAEGVSLLTLAAPLVLALLRERGEREGLGAVGLGRWLGRQREALRGALPHGVVHAVREKRAPAPPRPRTAWLLALLLVLGLGALWLLSREERAPELATGQPSVAAPPPAREGGPADRTRMSAPGAAALAAPGDLVRRLVDLLGSAGLAIRGSGPPPRSVTGT